MSITKARKTALSIGIIATLTLGMGLINVTTSYAEEENPTTAQNAYPKISFTETISFPTPDYQGKTNLKEYWDTVTGTRSEIAEMRGLFDILEPSEERWAQVDGLIAKAQEETELAVLETTKTELNGLLDTWTKELLEAAAVPASSYASQSGGSYYSYAIQSGILTRSGGVNYYGGRTETWYSQRVLPGGGLNIPGRHVAPDGTIRDADGYIVVAASDVPKGTVVDTSLGQGKVYDSGCAPGVTDIYTDW